MDTPALNATVEETCMNAWPALKEVFYDGWLIRLANGATRRTNSVNVIGPGRRPLMEKIAYAEAIYRAHDRPSYFRILSHAEPDLERALDARGYRHEDETCTLFMNFRRRKPPKPDAAIATDVHEGRPPQAWLDAHRRHSRRTPDEARALHAVLDVVAVPAFFAEARGDDGEIASVAFCGIHERLACVQWVVTDPEQRRKGLSQATLSALLGRAAAAGATGACLQVLASNVSAIALYERLGFACELYRYHYRVR
ncbi:MAG TPA: GNAT family N-acetyltransferase [Rhizomicrobium sp.]|jgi:ribosomal protein S18 acetylase RimI-like enzyme|nr:GNAT family N-acetyltransferase [Rhizomicrobium sp.]